MTLLKTAIGISSTRGASEQYNVGSDLYEMPQQSSQCEMSLPMLASIDASKGILDLAYASTGSNAGGLNVLILFGAREAGTNTVTMQSEVMHCQRTCPFSCKPTVAMTSFTKFCIRS